MKGVKREKKNKSVINMKSNELSAKKKYKERETKVDIQSNTKSKIGWDKFIHKEEIRKIKKKNRTVCPMRRTRRIEYIHLPMVLVLKVDASPRRVMYVH
jgi:hypothetical protein